MNNDKKSKQKQNKKTLILQRPTQSDGPQVLLLLFDVSSITYIRKIMFINTGLYYNSRSQLHRILLVMWAWDGNAVSQVVQFQPLTFSKTVCVISPTLF